MNSINRLIILFILIFIIILYLMLSEKYAEPDYKKTFERPFLECIEVDKNGIETRTEIIFITHPFADSQTNKLVNKEKYKYIGMCSYSEFPGLITNPHDRFSNKDDIAWQYNYDDIVDGWCHCFNLENEEKILGNSSKPRILLSESDFANEKYHTQKTNIDEKEFDFIYICLKDNDTCKDGWQSHIRNWDKAKDMLNIMCKKYNLRGLLVGRVNCNVSKCHSTTDFLEYIEFVKKFDKCKFIFVPNTKDASPRVVTEAMCYNLPVFMNENILGGWKYVKSGVSGEVFNDKNFETQLKLFLDNLKAYKSRDHFVSNYTTKHSGKQLLEFMKKVYPDRDYSNVEYMKPGI